jgi:hypothetical protein
MIEKRQCTNCKKIKEIKEFKVRRYKSGNFGFYSWCRECCNEYGKQYDKKNPTKVKETKRKYRSNNREMFRKIHRDWNHKNPYSSREAHWRERNIDINYEQYLVLKEQQNNRCLISGYEFVEGSVNKYGCHVDHDKQYRKNNVRGILCDIFNRGLGCFKDNKDVIQKAINYIQGNNFEYLVIEHKQCKYGEARVGNTKYGKNVRQDLLERQGNKCYICGNGFLNTVDCQLDHNHSNDLVRGLLCRGCNAGLGKFNDNIVFLQNAITYLQTWQTYRNLYNVEQVV